MTRNRDIFFSWFCWIPFCDSVITKMTIIMKYLLSMSQSCFLENKGIHILFIPYIYLQASPLSTGAFSFLSIIDKYNK